jgi:glycosyltransferase involved in cell wall biosynthesis
MAMETAIVATDVGGTRELVRPDLEALIVPPDDWRALAAAIGVVLEDRPAATQRALRARRRVETIFSLDARVARVESVYEQMLAEKRMKHASAGRRAVS